MWCHLHLMLLMLLPAIFIPACDSLSLAFHTMYSAYKLNKQSDNIVLTYSFPNFEPVHCSMSRSNCCFFSCIQVSQVTGKVVWYSYLCNNFPQFVVIHTVKGFSIVSEVEVDFFFNPLAFSVIQWVLAIWPLVPLPFLSQTCTSASTQFIYCWSLKKWDNQGAGHCLATWNSWRTCSY